MSIFLQNHLPVCLLALQVRVQISPRAITIFNKILILKLFGLKLENKD